MQVSLKVGSVVTLPIGDVADVSSNNPILTIDAGPTGGIIVTAVHAGDAVVTVKFGHFGHVSFYVKIVA